MFYLMHELLEHGLKRGGACLKAVVKLYCDLFSNCLKLGSDKRCSEHMTRASPLSRPPRAQVRMLNPVALLLCCQPA